MSEEFDYVIVGAGSAGCVLAARLSEDPDIRVALLEAGGEDTQPEIRIPAIFPIMFKTELDWDLFGDPEALLGDLLTPEFRRSSDQLTALAVVIDAYADHIAELVGQKLVGSHSQLAEAWYRRRIERGKGEEAAGALFGLDLEQSQVDRGRAFIAGVVERAGEEALGRLWSSPRNLPTPPEVDAPGLWLERISLG